MDSKDLKDCYLEHRYCSITAVSVPICKPSVHPWIMSLLKEQIALQFHTQFRYVAKRFTKIYGLLILTKIL